MRSRRIPSKRTNWSFLSRERGKIQLLLAKDKHPGLTCLAVGLATGPQDPLVLGTPLICPPGLEQDGALCYEPCKEGYDGVAFVWYVRILRVAINIMPSYQSSNLNVCFCNAKLATMSRWILRVRVCRYSKLTDQRGSLHWSSDVRGVRCWVHQR